MELDTEAWTRWVAYRVAIKKPLKPMSEEAAKMKLMRFGEDQAGVVDQSIAHGWLGWFSLPKSKADPAKKTPEKIRADAEHFGYLNRQSQTDWDKRLAVNPLLAKLQLAATLLARYDAESDQSSVILSEKRAWLKERVGQLLKDCHDLVVLNDYTVRGLVLRIFSDAGLHRLDKRLAEERKAA